MAHPSRVMGEALVAAALMELGDRLTAPKSKMWMWLDEVTRPPEDIEVNAEHTYSGLLVVVKNKIRRALVLEHRGGSPERRRPEEPQQPRHRDGWGNPVRQPVSPSWEDTYGTPYDPEDDGRLPNF